MASFSSMECENSIKTFPGRPGSSRRPFRVDSAPLPPFMLPSSIRLQPMFSTGPTLSDTVRSARTSVSQTANQRGDKITQARLNALLTDTDTDSSNDGSQGNPWGEILQKRDFMLDRYSSKRDAQGPLDEPASSSLERGLRSLEARPGPHGEHEEMEKGLIPPLLLTDFPPIQRMECRKLHVPLGISGTHLLGGTSLPAPRLVPQMQLKTTTTAFKNYPGLASPVCPSMNSSLRSMDGRILRAPEPFPRPLPRDDRMRSYVVEILLAEDEVIDIELDNDGDTPVSVDVESFGAEIRYMNGETRLGTLTLEA